MAKKPFPSRLFDRDFYNFFRVKIEEAWLPDSWEQFQHMLHEDLPESPGLTEEEKGALWQAGTAFRVGCGLIQAEEWIDPAIAKLPTYGVQTAGLQLIFYGVFVQLRSWEHRFPSPKRSGSLLSHLIRYLNSEKLKDFRNALAHSGDESGSTYFMFDAESQSVTFSTRRVRKERKNGQISLHEAIFAAFLWWILFSEWCWSSLASHR
jgi:hypothetical protein